MYVYEYIEATLHTTTKIERERESQRKKKRTNHFKLRLINDITVALKP